MMDQLSLWELGYVYVAMERFSNKVKVGYTSELPQAYCMSKGWKLVYAVRGSYALEQRTHAKLRAVGIYPMPGAVEWYPSSPELWACLAEFYGRRYDRRAA